MIRRLRDHVKKNTVVYVVVLLLASVPFLILQQNASRARASKANADRQNAILQLASAQLDLAKLQHECLLPALSGQHKKGQPDYEEPHVHECYDATFGQVLKRLQDQSTATAATSNAAVTAANNATAAAQDAKRVADFLSSPERQKTVTDALAAIQESQRQLFANSRFQVVDPSQPNKAPLIVTPAPSPTCPPVLGVGGAALTLCPAPAP